MLRSKIECAISEGAESSSDELAHSVCVISILGRELTANFDLLIIKREVEVPINCRYAASIRC